MAGPDHGNPFAYLTQSPHVQDDQSPFHYVQNHHSSWASTLGQPLVQFQMPHFMHSSLPALAEGGGAEVLPAAVFNSMNQNPYPSWSSSAYMKSEIPEKQQLNKPVHHELPACGAPLNLSLYSATGFDVLAVLSRVFTRPNPQVLLGPVDFTSSFCVVDLKRFDAPVIYCSPSFCSLTGYEESEIIGRNCRFLQSPPNAGPLERGSRRLHTDQRQVGTLAKSIALGKPSFALLPTLANRAIGQECQLSLANYRKDGSPFNNLITVIPLREDVNDPQSEIIYYVGFQVDLTAQPHSIMERLSTGRYLLDDPLLKTPPAGVGKERRVPISPNVLSNDLQQLLSSPDFLLSASPGMFVESNNSEASHPLSSVLLSALPDFIHVLSLKGAFLYCSPVVGSVLGWDSAELIGKSLSDICHPADLVGVLRELKEGATGATATSSDDASSSTTHKSRPICLLFRALTKYGSQPSPQYVWLECRGRLYSEPGKGRKAIILSGRARAMWSMDWSDINQLGIMVPITPTFLGKRKRTGDNIDGEHVVHQEAWGLLSGNGTCLAIDEAAKSLIGWESTDIVGTPLADVLQVERHPAATSVRTALRKLCLAPSAGAIERLKGKITRKDGSVIPVLLAVFSSSAFSDPIDCAPFVFQIRLDFGEPARPVLSKGQVFAPLVASTHPSASFNSSWQYEIQQVRYENARLLEEIEKLEDAVASVTSTSTEPSAEGALTTALDRGLSNMEGGYEDGGIHAHGEGQSGTLFNIHPLPLQPRARSDSSRHGAASGAGSASASAEHHNRYENGQPSALNSGQSLLSNNFSLSLPSGRPGQFPFQKTLRVFSPSLFRSGFLTGSNQTSRISRTLRLGDSASQDWHIQHDFGLVRHHDPAQNLRFPPQPSPT